MCSWSAVCASPLLASPRLPPPLFTGPLARPDLCHHPPYKHFPLRHSQSGKLGRATARARERERERERKRGRGERVSSSQPTNQPTHANTLRSLAEYCPIARATASEMPIGRKALFFQAELGPRRESQACSAPT